MEIFSILSQLLHNLGISTHWSMWRSMLVASWRLHAGIYLLNFQVSMHGCETKSGSGLGKRLQLMLVLVSRAPTTMTIAIWHERLVNSWFCVQSRGALQVAIESKLLCTLYVSSVFRLFPQKSSINFWWLEYSLTDDWLITNHYLCCIMVLHVTGII